MDYSVSHIKDDVLIEKAIKLKLVRFYSRINTTKELNWRFAGVGGHNPTNELEGEILFLHTNLNCHFRIESCLFPKRARLS
jgi:hypothetical protein